MKAQISHRRLTQEEHDQLYRDKIQMKRDYYNAIKIVANPAPKDSLQQALEDYYKLGGKPE